MAANLYDGRVGSLRERFLGLALHPIVSKGNHGQDPDGV